MYKKSCLAVLLSFAVVFTSLQPGSAAASDRSEDSASPHLVPLHEAREEAVRFLTEKAARASFNRERKIAAHHTERDGQHAAFHVFNLENGGFVIVSAVRGQAAILAHSEEGGFPIVGGGENTVLDSASMPDGLLAWIAETKVVTRRIWEGKGVEAALIPGEGEGCTTSYHNVQSLNFPTKWNQGCGYNDRAPLAEGGPCNRAWAGCVAVVIAQIMRYHQYPSFYNWAAMSNTSADSNIAQLLRDAGNAVGMSYGADGSGAYMHNVDDAFVQFGYATTAEEVGYLSSRISNEINAGRPVAMSGSRDCNFLGFPTCGGHAWVVHGYEERYVCETGILYEYLLINWGWGSSFDGWYKSYALNPGDNDYNYNKRLVIGIKPPPPPPPSDPYACPSGQYCCEPGINSCAYCVSSGSYCP